MKWFPILVLFVLLVAILSGCASTRYLSDEEEAQMAKTCGPNHDCAVIPGEQWRIIEKILQKMIGI